MTRPDEEIMAEATELLDDPTLSPDLRAELLDAMRTKYPAKYNGPSIAGTTMVPNPDGWLVVGPVEGDAVKERIVREFHDQLYGDDD